MNEQFIDRVINILVEMKLDEARGDTILKMAGGDSEGITIPQRAKPVTDPKTGVTTAGKPRTSIGFRKKVAHAQAGRLVGGLLRASSGKSN